MSSKPLADKAAFLGASQRRYAYVDIDVIGRVRIRNLFEDEMSEFEAQSLNSKGQTSVEKLKSMRRKLIVLCVVGEDDQPLFEPGDHNALRRIDGLPLAQLQAEIQKHVGYSDGDLERLAKNCVATEDSDLPIESPSVAE